jgi:hypothetical protein
VDPDAMTYFGRMTPRSFVRWQGCRRIRVVSGRVIIGQLTPLHELERLPRLSMARASPRCRQVAFTYRRATISRRATSG